MDKKVLKLYVTPEEEIIDMELEGQVLTASDPEGGELPTNPIEEVD